MNDAEYGSIVADHRADRRDDMGGDAPDLLQRRFHREGHPGQHLSDERVGLLDTGRPAGDIVDRRRRCAHDRDFKPGPGRVAENLTAAVTHGQISPAADLDAVIDLLMAMIVFVGVSRDDIDRIPATLRIIRSGITIR
ncbi:hypothetical protein E3T43_09965 [Cryobacterium sp. Hh7]|uniref:hypothetical protein n=1 Tax=Cryobacterium sp. Hh7 TaxID=1259159 RepID=UPI00106D2B83|nr:hypothetical protein [Cryobacterium sp. Hh7]TFD56134.1 hypothetical protein E3T43_09965 [Cryobacterium sp. Hh7]